MFEIGVLGSIAYDTIFSADRVPVKGERVLGKQLGEYIGGMAANQALEAARYTDSVRLMGNVGMDDAGKKIIRQLKKRGVDTTYIGRDRDQVSGRSFMYLVDDDYFSIVTQGANRKIRQGDIIEAVETMEGGLLLISLEINREAAAAALECAKAKGIETFLVPSPAENCSQELFEAADSLILNERETALLLDLTIEGMEDACGKLAGLKGKKRRILVTMGGKGAVLLDGKEVVASKSLEVDAVDTIGAGDALAGAFAASLAKGYSSQKALSIGCIAGALAASTFGAQTSRHTSRDVLDLYKTNYHS